LEIAVFEGVGHFGLKFQVEGDILTNRLYSLNALQLCRWSFHTKKLQQTFFERSTLLEEKMVNLRFWAPFGGLRATYAVHLRLIGKFV